MSPNLLMGPVDVVFSYAEPLGLMDRADLRALVDRVQEAVRTEARRRDLRCPVLTAFTVREPDLRGVAYLVDDAGWVCARFVVEWDSISLPLD